MDAIAVDALAKEVDIIELKQGQTRLMGNRRDLFPANAAQKATSSPTGSQINRAAGANTAL